MSQHVDHDARRVMLLRERRLALIAFTFAFIVAIFVVRMAT